MTDWTGIAAVIAPITTLLGVLGGYGLAGRNEDARDRRAAQREQRARLDAFAERLEESRHTFQRDTLLELQDELQRYVRNTAQVMMQDRATIKERGQMYLLPGSLGGEEARMISVSLQRLRARVIDDQLREQIGEFMEFCTRQGLEMLQVYPSGTVPDGQREAALKRIDRQNLEIAQAYDRLTNVLGIHLRRELDRRYLVSGSAGGSR